MRRYQSMEQLERRLQFSMVAYVGGARRDLSSEFVLEALSAKAGVSREWVSVILPRPEDFLVVFGREEHRNRVTAIPVFEHNGVRLFFRPWNRQAQEVHSMLRFKVTLEIEGIPPHASDREVVECLLGSSCMVDTVVPETHSRAVLSSFKVSAWTANPKAIPAIRWLAVPEPGMCSPLVEPTLLQYKVLIHLDEVWDFSNASEPWFLGSSSSSGQSCWRKLHGK